jgi:hypothetical protein
MRASGAIEIRQVSLSMGIACMVRGTVGQVDLDVARAGWAAAAIRAPAAPTRDARGRAAGPELCGQEPGHRNRDRNGAGPGSRPRGAPARCLPGTRSCG